MKVMILIGVLRPNKVVLYVRTCLGLVDSVKTHLGLVYSSRGYLLGEPNKLL